MLITGGILFLILLDPVLKMLGVSGGLDERILISMGRVEHTGGSFSFMMIIECLAAWFGPFPNFVGGAETPLFLYNFYLLFKSLFSVYFVYGLYRLYKNSSQYFNVVFSYVILNVLLMIFAFVALDFRYQLTYYPLFLVLGVYGFQERVSNGWGKHSKTFFLAKAGVLLLILCYNFR